MYLTLKFAYFNKLKVSQEANKPLSPSCSLDFDKHIFLKQTQTFFEISFYLELILPHAEIIFLRLFSCSLPLSYDVRNI